MKNESQVKRNLELMWQAFMWTVILSAVLLASSTRADTINATSGVVNAPNGTASNPTVVTGKCAGVVLANPAQWVTIDGLDVDSAGDAIRAPGDWSDCKVIRSRLKWGRGFCGIQRGGNSTRITVGGTPANSNFFHDSPSAANGRDANFGSTTDVIYSYNRFYHTGYAAHFYGKHVRLRLEGNTYAHTWRVRGDEIQEASTNPADASDDILYRDNVIYDILNPNVDSFGASIPPQMCKNVRVEDCYFGLFDIGKNTPTDGWGLGNRAGYGLETGGRNFWVKRCVFAGKWVTAITYMEDTHVQGCSFYNDGAYEWHDATPWSNADQSNFQAERKLIDEGGNKIGTLAQAPAPWRTLDPDGTIHGVYLNPGSTTTTQPTGPTLAVSSVTDTEATITITGQGTKYEVIIGTPLTQLARIDTKGAKTVTLTGLPALWNLVATPVVDGVNGTATAFKMGGMVSASYPYNGALIVVKGGATTQPVDPAPADFDVDVKVQIRGGKATATATTRKAA